MPSVLFWVVVRAATACCGRTTRTRKRKDKRKDKDTQVLGYQKVMGAPNGINLVPFMGVPAFLKGNDIIASDSLL